MTLLQFLRQARQLHLQFLAGALSEPPVYVLGNTSADLDSIISAIVFSYCAHNRLPSNAPRSYIPLVNLANVPSGPELYRLRPEFVTALWLSTNFPPLPSEEPFDNTSQSASKFLSEHLVTVADFAQTVTGQHSSSPSETQIQADTVMVDWNAMPQRLDSGPGYGSISGLDGVTFGTVGCIDHHVDEGFVPQLEINSAEYPCVIEPGPGSCSSLVTRELRTRGLWSGSNSHQVSEAEWAQVAKLTLAPILIDTSNLTAEGKVKEVDIQSVDFLRDMVSRANGGVGAEWDMVAFYEKIHKAKAESLNLLTPAEILDRDYKEWVEKTHRSGTTIKLGFCCSVRPLRWIIQKAGGPQQFMEVVRQFAQDREKELDLVVVMTSFSSSKGEHTRELFVSASQEKGLPIDGAQNFAEESTSLGLTEWTSLDGESVDVADDEIRKVLNGTSGGWRQLWLQKNATASRKRVAPLLREALTRL
ncbi:hypothetical protein N7539_000381 [Penicillium diatomitis]|uniref:DHHA2 domain-containing protein n=1 Tax=Penicillium diatomitis TaxID=2819901 RepID=A0A9X0C2L1_9EURO|nr:uncharacterized protein N7539_000381 [Penicillium diatomitis]KAJ5495265.1 hypothetical protein N7539_000381 [Penicillium diatomitis]